jgi:WD40 repeat protein
MVWDAASGAEMMSIDHVKNVTMVALSPDGKLIAACGSVKMISVCEAETGAEIMKVRGYGLYLAFSPDGKRIASCDRDQIIRIWDIDSGAKIMTLRGDGSCLAFSPDGSRIASGSSNNTIKVWELETGAEVLTLRGHQSGISTIAFTPDGTSIVSGSYDGTIRLWETGPPTDGYRLRQAGEAARKLVDRLHQKYSSYGAVIGQLHSDTTLDDLVRKEALRIAESRKWEDTAL